LRGARRRVPAGILSYKTLERLYADYPVTDLRTARNRVILGLIVYQGLTCGELHRLSVQDIKLREGKIQVPGDRRSHHRVLELKSFQVIELHEYLTQVRPAILSQAGTPKPGGRVARKTRIQDPDRLFASVNGSGNLKNSLHHLFCFLKKMNPEVKNPGQIRQSVIAHWLKNHNLRQVQYMAGHRWVSSTERYRLDNLEGLQAELDRYHPLG
jgi:integrase/recombinase XerD